MLPLLRLDFSLRITVMHLCFVQCNKSAKEVAKKSLLALDVPASEKVEQPGNSSNRHLSRVQMVMDDFFHRPYTDFDVMG